MRTPLELEQLSNSLAESYGIYRENYDLFRIAFLEGYNQGILDSTEVIRQQNEVINYLKEKLHKTIEVNNKNRTNNR